MSSEPSTSDRDLSFKEIEFDGKASRIMERIVSPAEGSDDACQAYFYKRPNTTSVEERVPFRNAP